MLPKVSELTTEPVVGQYYMVPCVRMRHQWLHSLHMKGWVPVSGPSHEDADYIGFPDEHWHFDIRFIRTTTWTFGEVARCNAVEMGPMLRKKKCIRSMPDYPTFEIPWMPKLESAYSDKKMKCMTCPHRGLPLNGLPVVNGIVTCPGHGLRWNVSDGSLVPRNLPSASAEKAG